MVEHDQVSEEDAIRQAKEELGEEAIAKLQELPPAVREALLKACSPKESPPKPRNRGGRPKGSGKMNLDSALLRMAELREDDPNLDIRPVSRRVAEEERARGLHVAAETLRKEYSERREELHAKIRERRRPRSPVVTAVIPRPTGGGFPAGFTGYLHAAEYPADFAAKAATTLAADAAAYLAADKAAYMAGQSIADLTSKIAFPVEDLARLSAIPDAAKSLSLADYAKTFELANPARAMEEEISRLKNLSGEAYRGLAFLLGEKLPK